METPKGQKESELQNNTSSRHALNNAIGTGEHKQCDNMHRFTGIGCTAEDSPSHDIHNHSRISHIRMVSLRHTRNYPCWVHHRRGWAWLRRRVAIELHPKQSANVDRVVRDLRGRHWAQEGQVKRSFAHIWWKVSHP